MIDLRLLGCYKFIYLRKPLVQARHIAFVSAKFQAHIRYFAVFVFN